MTMKASYVGSAIIGIVLLSCGTPTENELASVELLTDHTTYVIGDSAVLTVTNRGTSSITYLLCTLGIERKAGTDWEPVDAGPVGCIESDFRELGRFESEEWQLQVPTSAGEYRFRVTVLRPRGQRSLVFSSNPFTVRR
jgi:hypothetical protein